MNRFARIAPLLALCCAVSSTAPAQSATFDWKAYQLPDWQRFRARDASTLYPPAGALRAAYTPKDSRRVTYDDLQHESDASLARRLLGANGERVAFIDRHVSQWQYYDGKDDAADSIDLYTHPARLGSQFGLCGVEKYSIGFDEDGRIDHVEMQQRYGIEGPVLQKKDFDWDSYHNVMCTTAPAARAPSYFPARDTFLAHNAARLLTVMFDLMGRSQPLPFPCKDHKGRACSPGLRQYLSQMRLEDIDDLDLSKCTQQPEHVCFTVSTGEGELGPFPKHITVRGSTYMNEFRIDSVDVVEDITVS